ncbi:uncharacterized protein [Amphiura filiformis]|uniref:uncharacterized protein n=1 Tax=Amphiura filiformis TaxID=82378 RepID=UPI003B226DFB
MDDMLLVFVITAGISSVVLPGTDAQLNVYCFGPVHECCSLPTVDEITVFADFSVRYGSNGAQLNVNVTWTEPQTSSVFNGYGVCFQEGTYNNQPPGIACNRVGQECDYQTTRISAFSFEDVSFGKSFYFIVRLAQWNNDGTYAYLAPREIGVSVDTPECSEIVNDDSSCYQQGTLFNCLNV